MSLDPGQGPCAPPARQIGSALASAGAGALMLERYGSSFADTIRWRLSVSDAFISYSHLDREFAVRLQRALRDSEKAIWVDESDIPSGARWAEDLKGAIEDADSF